MRYNLWDVETNGYFGQYEDEDKALALVKTLVSRYGAGYADSLVLGSVGDDGKIGEPLSGAALMARANVVIAEREVAAARRSH